jgi:molybdopterin/thiamine biosynthesis adenylyltransferase
MSITLHETLYRGQEAMEKLELARIVVCGVGALGSPLVDNLVRHGARHILVVDKDRVEEHNIGTQVFERTEIGGWKAEMVASRAFRASGAEIEGVTKELTTQNIAKITRGADVVIDCFDNSASRRLVADWCLEKSLACLHLGVNIDYGEVKWNEHYLVPGDVEGAGACDYPLARNLLLFVVALGSESLLRYLWRGEKADFSFTLEDFSINFENALDLLK